MYNWSCNTFTLVIKVMRRKSVKLCRRRIWGNEHISVSIWFGLEGRQVINQCFSLPSVSPFQRVQNSINILNFYVPPHGNTLTISRMAPFLTVSQVTKDHNPLTLGLRNMKGGNYFSFVGPPRLLLHYDIMTPSMYRVTFSSFFAFSPT